MGEQNIDSWFYNDGKRSYLFKHDPTGELFSEFLTANPQYSRGRLPSDLASKSREGWVALTDGERDFWLPKEYRGRLNEYLSLNPQIRVGRKKRAPFKRRTKAEMADGLPRPSKRRMK